MSPDKAATGQVITFAANDENLDVQGRAGSVTFKLDGGLALTVPVKQGITETILVQSTSVELESMAGDFIVKTLTNVDYSVHSDVSWIHPLGTKALLEFEEQFSAEENLGSTPRTGHITFIYNNISETVTVTQAGRDPVLDVTAPGFYGLQGKDYVYRKGLCQYTRYNYGEYRAYRLIIPSEVCVVQVQGLPVQPSSGDTIQLAVSVHQNGQTIYSQPANMKVLGNDDSFIWLKSTTNGSTYFVIKKLR